MFVSVNGKILPIDEAFIPAVTDGLFYGAGCFETFKSYSGSFLHLNRHIDRLNEGVNFLTGSDESFFSVDEIKKELSQLLEKNKLENKEGIVRIQAFLSERIGYKTSDRPQVQKVTALSKLEPTADPQSLVTSEIHVVPSSCKPAHLKLSNMLHYRQAGISAKKSGAHDALMITLEGNVAETSIGNLFWEQDHTVYTPSAKCDILPGIMRSVVLKILNKMGITVKEGEFSRADILDCPHVWFTNSVSEIVQVSRIDEHIFETDTAFINQLKKELHYYKQGQLH